MTRAKLVAEIFDALGRPKCRANPAGTISSFSFPEYQIYGEREVRRSWDAMIRAVFGIKV